MFSWVPQWMQELVHSDGQIWTSAESELTVPIQVGDNHGDSNVQDPATSESSKFSTSNPNDGLAIDASEQAMPQELSYTSLEPIYTPQQPNPTAPAQVDNNHEDPSAQDPATPDSSEPLPRLFALLIGINKYEKKPLLGAVKDITDVDSYLRNDLQRQMPKLRLGEIVTVIDEAATRERIIKELEQLVVNDKIQNGDPILIYFSGHGAIADAPEEWKKYCQKFEYIVPYDADMKTGSGMIAARKLGYCLRKICEAKGDNITIVLDCCHSGSVIRANYDNENGTIRGIEIKPNSTDCSSGIWPEDEFQSEDAVPISSFSEGLASYGISSHVLLAACGPYQGAYEKDGQGVFTKELLKNLKNQDRKVMNKLTYEDLITQIGSSCPPTQTPQCQGINRTRPIFSKATWSTSKYLHPVIHTIGKDYKYIIQGGTVRGITAGTRFLLYENQLALENDNHLAIMIAHEELNGDIALKPESTLEKPIPESDDESGLLAFQISVGEKEYLHVYAAVEDKIYPMLQRFEQRRADNAKEWGWQIKLVDREISFIGLSLDKEGLVSIEILDKDCRFWGMKHLTRKLKVDPTAKYDENLASFLESVAFFRKHLNQAHPCPQTQRKIETQFSELVDSIDSERCLVWKPKTRIIEGTPIVDNLIHVLDKKIELLIPEDGSNPGCDIMTAGRYGMTIRNNSTLPLYVSVFYFSVGDFQIMKYYQPPHVANGPKNNLNGDVPCIGPQQELAIGHSGSIWPAWRYGIGASQDIDLGIIKAFFSTKPVSLSYLEQASAFDKPRMCYRTDVDFAWFTIDIPVIQRRTKSHLLNPSYTVS